MATRILRMYALCPGGALCTLCCGSHARNRRFGVRCVRVLLVATVDTCVCRVPVLVVMEKTGRHNRWNIFAEIQKQTVRNGNF